MNFLAIHSAEIEKHSMGPNVAAPTLRLVNFAKSFGHPCEQTLHLKMNLLIDNVLHDLDQVIVTNVPYQINQQAACLKQELE